MLRRSHTDWRSARISWRPWWNHWITKWGSDLWLSSCNTTTMRCPIEFEAFVRATRYLFPVQRMKNIPGSLKVWKFNETVSYRLPSFISDQLHACYSGNLIKLLSDVVLIHPRLNISYPKSPTLCLRTLRSLIVLLIMFRPWHPDRGLGLSWRVHVHTIHRFVEKVLSFKY